MGDEQRTEAAKPAAPAQPAAEPAPTGRDQDAVRPAAAAAAAIGGDDDGQEATGRDGNVEGGRREGRVGRGLGTRPEAIAEAGGETDGVDVGKAAESEIGVTITLDEIEAHVVRAIRYHEARARFLDFWRRFFDFVVILLGAGAVTTATGEHTLAGTIVGILTAAFGALQLVAGFSEKAGEHTALKRRFCGVLADITEARNEPNPDRRLPKITKKWAAIWADEPPTLHVLEAIAYNAARRTREFDLDEGTLIEITPWQSLTRNLSSWEGFEPLTRAERAARREIAPRRPAWWQRRND